MAEIPGWAKKRACELVNVCCNGMHAYTADAVAPHNPSIYAFAAYIAAHEEEPGAVPRLGLACAAVAEAVFYHNNDRRQRERLALALVDLAQEIRRETSHAS